MDTDNGITRRTALKRMGLALAGALMSSSGVLSLTSCDRKDAKRVLLYFTGTGNCLYVARQLAGKNGEKNPNARYRNEYVSLMDIKRANTQF